MCAESSVASTDE